MIKIGPSGIGGIKEAKENLEYIHKNKLKAAEIAFTYSTYLKKEGAIEIGKLAKKLSIDLSIHGSYFINLNSTDKKKVAMSKKRILDACEIGNYLGAKYIVFHPGFVGKSTREETYENIKKEMIFLQKYVEDKKWDVKLAPETTGKVSVFGSLDETLKLAKESGTAFCIDFAHLKARNNGKIDFKEVIKKLKGYKHIHCHYSGIAYSEKGEKNHIPIEIKEFKTIISELKKQKINCTIICEAPDTYGDAIKMQNENKS
ncbi:TIM barrel protein [Candidatus Woesearchaeota archaeon]|nr:TIM barrel protein [Candidatus Woesearchaeota archaeon]